MITARAAQHQVLGYYQSIHSAHRFSAHITPSRATVCSCSAKFGLRQRATALESGTKGKKHACREYFYCELSLYVSFV